ncbi:hypothetical protein [Hoeflea sp.]|uniref:hypothetical protein n=1 Tax=Hoeflea sp. TaxID=1940281 RepID=UPI003A8CF0E3
MMQRQPISGKAHETQRVVHLFYQLADLPAVALINVCGYILSKGQEKEVKGANERVI